MRSKVEILPGTVRANSGPHPSVVHVDEVELMEEETWHAVKAVKIRPLLLLDETLLQFDERTGYKLHVYPDECDHCDTATRHAVITRGFEGAGESWCLNCGSES